MNKGTQPQKQRRQVHFWVSDGDYEFIRELAQQQGETISTTLRRLVRRVRVASTEAHTEHLPSGRSRTPSSRA
jgi:hypothetical protein